MTSSWLKSGLVALCMSMAWIAGQAQQSPAATNATNSQAGVTPIHAEKQQSSSSAQTKAPPAPSPSTPTQSEKPNTGPVLLRIQTPWQDTLSLTEQDLLALPQTEVRTSTPWTDGTRIFRGPLLRDVLKLAAREHDVLNTSLLAKSLNDYHVQIPSSDAWKWDVIIALRMNGHPMSRRDKGPLWIIYPRDSHAELKRPHYDHRWPWQLHFIELYELP
ncbi:molybdopterin-dependent oxidoreductase [Vandammella animalimorsus]|nr:molybdopterin-dependent oxidoreductase [Vandammella animalimorsus]